MYADEGRLTSFRFGYIVSGDVLYLPHGACVCEKAVGQHNVAMRVPAMIFSSYHMRTNALMSLIYPAPLGHNSASQFE